MSEMIERVAEALRERCEGPRGDFKWADDAGLPAYRKMARAAIEAMREPTQHQMTQGYQFLLSDSSKNGYGDRTDAEKMERMRGFYRAMIAAALTNGEG